MKIKEWIDQNRNDFWCTYECEHCNHVTGKSSGYNDDYFHNHVIPAKYCPACGLNRAGETKEQSGVNENCVEAA